jgi:hypothetical protein
VPSAAPRRGNAVAAPPREDCRVTDAREDHHVQDARQRCSTMPSISVKLKHHIYRHPQLL